MIRHTEIILYVADQEVSKVFYEKILRLKPNLHVSGMTEFVLSPTCKLGLMPNSGIAKILTDKTPDPSTGTGIPRCELYLLVDSAQGEYDNAVSCGAKLVSPPTARNWGDVVGYITDPDGHIIAFAERK